MQKANSNIPYLFINFTLILLLISFNAWAELAEKNHPELGVAIGKKTGNVTFQIGGFLSDGEFIGKAHFPISELIFPTNYDTVEFSALFDILPAWDLKIIAETNSSNYTGLMEDRDWLTPDTLDIYSESKTTVTAREVRLEARKRLSPLQLSAQSALLENKVGFGVFWQYLKFRGSDAIQSYPGSEHPSDEIHGDVITYRFSHFTPFANYTVAFKPTNALILDLNTMLSPLLLASDKDNHLLRDKVSESDTRGWLLYCAFNISWIITRNFSAFGLVDYQRFEANGKQTQSLNKDSGVEKLQVKVKHLGQITNYRLGLNYRF